MPGDEIVVPKGITRIHAEKERKRHSLDKKMVPKNNIDMVTYTLENMMINF